MRLSVDNISGNGIIYGTNYVLKRVGYTYMVNRRTDGLLKASDKVNLIRTGLLYGEVVDSNVQCPECAELADASSLQEFTCGHYYHRECSPQTCIVCLGRGKPMEKEFEVKTEKDCIVCCNKVKEEKLECGHSVHRRCIARWGTSICPICRTVIKLPEEYQWLRDQVNSERKRETERQDHEIAVQLQMRFGGF